MAKGRKAKAERERQGAQPAGGARGKRGSKELQKLIDGVTAIAKEPLAREIVVAAAGAAIAARKDARKAAKRAAHDAGDAIGGSPAAAGWLGAAVTAAAVEAGRRLLAAYDSKNGKSGNGKSAKLLRAGEDESPKSGD